MCKLRSLCQEMRAEVCRRIEPAELPPRAGCPEVHRLRRMRCQLTRSGKKYYRLTLLGRTGKKNPRMGEDFIKWADEESIIKIILNTYDYVKEYIDPHAPGGKEHIGYIVDRTGFEEFKRWALKDVQLPEKAEVMSPVYWKGINY